MPRTIEMPPSLSEAWSKMMALAEPGEMVEVSLVDALGLVLAEDAVADVDLPPFDRAVLEGYAVNSAEAQVGTLLRVAGLRWSNRPLDDALEAGETIRVRPGDPLPLGADAVLPLDCVRPDPETGPTRVIEVLRLAESGQEVAARGRLLEAGQVLEPAGTRLEAAMVGLLASQGCVQPLCHRRVRVAIVAVGGHLVGPSEAPVMHRERNAAGATLVAAVVRSGAMPHDLQAVSESDLPAALERASSAPVILLLGPSSRQTTRALRSLGAESVIVGVAMKPGGRSRYSVIRDDSGRVAQHIFQLPLLPPAASTAFALLVRPLITRLQGGPAVGPRTVAAAWEGTHRAIVDRLRAVPVALSIGPDARQRARPIALRGPDDLASFAGANGLALLPAGSGPWLGGEIVPVVPFD